MNKTWVSSSSTARPRPQRGRGARAGSFSGPTEQQQRLGDGRFAQRSSLREDEEWGQQTQARSSLSGGGFEDPAPMSISQVSGGQEERQLQRYVDFVVVAFTRFCTPWLAYAGKERITSNPQSLHKPRS